MSDEALKYARYLATSIHAKHYPEVTQWSPLEDTVGILTQIDNMVAGLSRTPNVKPLVWENWHFGDAFARTPLGVYNTREGEWRAPRKQSVWNKSDNPRAAAQADYERRILEALE